MKKTYTVPENKANISKEIVSNILASIPNKWRYLRGNLHAPQNMIDLGTALASTKLVFETSICQMIARTNTEQVADIFGILIEGKKPSSIEFGRGLGYCEVMPVNQSKKIAENFIRLGYRGRLVFADRQTEYYGDPHNFECDIWLPSQDEKKLPIFELESHVEEWPEDDLTLTTIIDACEKLGLIAPQSVAA